MYAHIWIHKVVVDWVRMSTFSARPEVVLSSDNMRTMYRLLHEILPVADVAENTAEVVLVFASESAGRVAAEDGQDAGDVFGRRELYSVDGPAR